MWYKILKSASPIFPLDRSVSYLDIGHQNDWDIDKDERLWYIDKQFSLHVSDKYLKYHTRWKDYLKNEDNIIAQGRFSPKDMTCSCSITPSGNMLSHGLLSSKIEKMLDSAFYNPKIYMF